MREKFAFIMRGISGSGKSTIARRLAGRNGIIHSTDDYLVTDGLYFWDESRIQECHDHNLGAFRRSVARGVPTVICDNVNARREHFMPYIQVAQRNGYVVSIVELPRPDIDVAVARNLHHARREVIEMQIEAWETYP